MGGTKRRWFEKPGYRQGHQFSLRCLIETKLNSCNFKSLINTFIVKFNIHVHISCSLVGIGVVTAHKFAKRGRGSHLNSSVAVKLDNICIFSLQFKYMIFHIFICIRLSVTYLLPYASSQICGCCHFHFPSCIF